MSTTVGRPDSDTADSQPPAKGTAAKLAFAWAFVGIPLAYGIYETAKKASALFTG